MQLEIIGGTMEIRMTKIVINIESQQADDLEEARRIINNLRLLRDDRTVIELWDGKKLIFKTYGLKPSKGG